jgi:hypothetical protein
MLRVRTRSPRGPRWLLTVACAAAMACGAPQGPSHPSHPSRHGDEGGAIGESSAEAATAPQASYCNDEGCFNCGETFCLQGWFCDLSVRGGPACSFLPECEGQSSCACVSPALGGACRCEERDGGAFVRCD